MANDDLDIKAFSIKVADYNCYARNWKYVYWSIGVGGVACSAMAAANLCPCANQAFSVGATVCFGIMGFANPMKQAIKYDRAANKLDIAVEKYRSGLFNAAQFINAYEDALEITTEEIESKSSKLQQSSSGSTSEG